MFSLTGTDAESGLSPGEYSQTDLLKRGPLSERAPPRQVHENEVSLFRASGTTRLLRPREEDAVTRLYYWGVLATAVVLGDSAVSFGVIGRHDVGGSFYAAYAEQFPSACMITLDGSCIGSGVLITPGYVLTAAHVAQLFDGSGESVRFVDGRIVGISQTVIYPGYSLGSRFDIAVIRMSYGLSDIDPTPVYDSS
jgi:hypothetical protein